MFSNTLLAIFDILIRSRVIYRFVLKNGPNWHEGVFFNITFFQKKFKKPEQGFFSSQILIADGKN